jgi:nitrate/nitrite transporter NarK
MQAVGTPGVALIFQHYGNYNNAFLMLTVMVVLAIFIIWLLKAPQEDFVNNS